MKQTEAAFKVVRVFDPAIRWARENEAKEGQADAIRYARERDFGALTQAIVDGKRPMVFHTRRLRRAEVRDIECLAGDPNRRDVAFSLGVEMVELPDGSPLRPVGERWTEAELEQFGFADVEDVGGVVLMRSTFPPGEKVPYIAPRAAGVLMTAILYPRTQDAPAP